MLYDKPVRLLLEECVAALPVDFRSDEAISWFAAHYPKVDQKTIRAHLRAFSANDPNRRHYSFGRGRPALLFKTGRSTYSRYDIERHGAFDENGASVDDLLEIDETDDPLADRSLPTEEAAAEFALEVYLEEFILTNWRRIEWPAPLTLYNGTEGHQFATPVGRLDFLAVDSSDDAFVVIELKRGRPSDQVIGQTARYMGWIHHEMARGRSVRGLVIAHGVDEKLKYAASVVSGLTVMTYELTFRLRPASIVQSSGSIAR